MQKCDNGLLLLQTRSAKYGKLLAGQALFLNNAGLVKKEVSHMKTISLPTAMQGAASSSQAQTALSRVEVQMVLGNNGGIWVGAPPAFKGDRIQTLNYSSETQVHHAVSSTISSSPSSSSSDEEENGQGGLTLQQRADAERLDALRPVVSACVEGIARLSRLGVQLSFERVAAVYGRMLELEGETQMDVDGSSERDAERSLDQWALDTFVLPAGQ